MAISKVYQLITDRILAHLENGVIPWRKPWTANPPANLITRKPYRGINVFLLAPQGYASPYWLTLKQANQKGGRIRKGEASTPVIFWNWKEKMNPETEEMEKYPILRFYRVWNVEQTEGLKLEDEAVPAFNPIARAASIIAKMPNPPKIVHGEPKAWYRPSDDLVNLPRPEIFNTPEEFYCTAFHELSHASGHESRLKRPGTAEKIDFGSHCYSNEELIAEMAAAFLCGHAGISQAVVENSAAYIDHWRRKISDDPKLIVLTSAAAQKAADHILGVEFDAED